MNPWQQQGVSLLPPDLKDLLPLVGQKSLFDELQRFKKNCLAEVSSEKLAGFFVLHGGWGVGKSRVGHEICLEAVSESVEWIVDTKPQRILKSGLADGILPLFTRYIHVTNGPTGDDLNAENWIPMVALEALSALVKFEGIHGGSPTLKRNQDRLIEHTIAALKPKGWNIHKTALAAALSNPDLDQAIRESMKVLEHLEVKSLWIVVDEIEDITDVDRDGLHSAERQPVKQELLTVIPRVIKAEENRMLYPGINFILLCSLAVGDLLKQVRAIERRTQRHELRTNAFTDVEAFFNYLRDHRPIVRQAIENYPPGLKEAAFFAANRNFGWFNVIMHDVHGNTRDGHMPAYELIRQFATTGQGESVVFDSALIGAYNIQQNADSSLIEEFMYGLLPKAVGLSIDEGKANRLLEKKDASGKALFTRVLEIDPPEAHRITSQFVRSGLTNEREAIMVLPGEIRFDLKLVMESLQAYSAIALRADQRDHLLVCETLAEFTAQMKALSPYAEQADQFAPILHGLLTDPSYRVKADGQPTVYVGPSFQFLSRFHRLNQLRVADEGYLTESRKNTHLQEAYRKVATDQDRHARALLAGVANVIEQDEAPVPREDIPGCPLPVIGFKTTLENFDLGPDGGIALVYAVRASDGDIERTLTELAGKRPAEPVLLLLQDEEERAVELRERLLVRLSPKMAPRVVVVSLTLYLAETLGRFGLLGEAFSPADMKTGHFNAGLARARDVFKDAMRNWRQGMLEWQGLILSPLFYGSRVSDEQIGIFARGYAAMLGGLSFQDVCQTGTGLFNEKERDDFRKLVDRQIDPNASFKKDLGSVPQLRLITKRGAEETAEVPRPLVALIQRCSRSGVALSSLEKDFFFDFPTSAGPAIKRSEIVRQSIHLLKCLGLVEQDQQTIRQVSKPALEKQIEGARHWLENRFEQSANKIRATHLEEGEKLVDHLAKEAKYTLKEAQTSLDSLSLDFLGKTWKELNRLNGDLPVYEERFKIALGIIHGIMLVLARVWDPERERGFTYGPDALGELQHAPSGQDYPLWKRLKILEGFYKEVEDRRKGLLRRVADVRQDVETQVPALPDGKNALPIQAITLPLDLFKRELDFAADHPNRTITVGGSTLGIKSLGFKLHGRKYVEARERLAEIEAELSAPGRIVSQFLECLKLWQSLRDQVKEAAEQVAKAETFYADAPDPVKRQAGLRLLTGELADLDDALNQGGIRQGVDEADAAGAQTTELIKVLEKELNQLAPQPALVRQKSQELLNGVVPILTERYQQENQDLIRGVSSIRKVEGQEIPAWPEHKAATYAATEERFAALVKAMRVDGEAFFQGVAGTRFDDYVELLKAQAEGRPIDWRDANHVIHMNNLQTKKLLELRLV